VITRTLYVSAMLAGFGLFQQTAQAVILDIDQLTVSRASGGILISGLPAADYSTPIVPPAIIQMGTYQDLSSPIYSWTSGSDSITVYSTGAYSDPTPTGTIDTDAATININFSSFRLAANLDGGTYNFDVSLWPIATPPTPTSSYNLVDSSYQLIWEVPFTIMVDIPLVGLQEVLGTVSVDLTGNVSAVPVPAAVWLFGSGLLGLAGLARRRKVA